MVNLYLGITDADIFQMTLGIMGAVLGLLIGLLIYVWKTALQDMKDRLNIVEQTIKGVASDKVSKEEHQRGNESTILAVREAQAQLLYLSERITEVMIEMPKEFAKEDNCQMKHKTMELILSQVQTGVTGLLVKMDNLTETINKFKIWQGKVDTKVGTGAHDSL